MLRTRWSLVVLWLVACGAPENRNPSRCSADDTCPAALMCYRGYCIAEPLDVGSDDDESSGSTNTRDAGAADAANSSQGDALSGATDAASVVGEGGASPVAPVSSEDASASAPPSAPTEPPPAAAPSQPTVPAEPSTPPAATPPAATPPAATPPAATPPATTPPVMPPVTTPPATPTTPPPSTPDNDASGIIIGLIGAGLAPVAMLTCVPSCVLGLGERDCQRCLQKALKDDYGSEACGQREDDDDEDDDDKKINRAPKEACALISCADKSCGEDQ
jgi:hypothetical protein